MRYILAITFAIFSTVSCQKKTDVESNSDLPPFELLESNYASSSHVAIMKVKQARIAERIYADDNTLGYIVFQITGDLVKAYKGSFDQSNEFVCSHVLEYSPKLENIKLDSILVFLNKDSESNEYSIIEVGRFDLQEGLIEMIEDVSQGRAY